MEKERKILDTVDEVICNMFEGNAEKGNRGGSPLHKSIQRLIMQSREFVKPLVNN